MTTLIFVSILTCLILGTGLIGALVAAWDVGDVDNAFEILFSMGVFYTAADLIYILGVS